MNNQTYKLTFLPLFEEDLLKVTDYITNTLQNPSAAHRLVDDIELAIVKRLEMPLSFAPYQSSKIRNHPYYRINVRNFSIFYVVIDYTMEVRRLLCSSFLDNLSPQCNIGIDMMIVKLLKMQDFHDFTLCINAMHST